MTLFTKKTIEAVHKQHFDTWASYYASNDPAVKKFNKDPSYFNSVFTASTRPDVDVSQATFNPEVGFLVCVEVGPNGSSEEPIDPEADDGSGNNSGPPSKVKKLVAIHHVFKTNNPTNPLQPYYGILGLPGDPNEMPQAVKVRTEWFNNVQNNQATKTPPISVLQSLISPADILKPIAECCPTNQLIDYTGCSYAVPIPASLISKFEDMPSPEMAFSTLREEFLATAVSLMAVELGDEEAESEEPEAVLRQQTIQDAKHLEIYNAILPLMQFIFLHCRKDENGECKLESLSTDDLMPVTEEHITNQVSLTSTPYVRGLRSPSSRNSGNNNSAGPNDNNFRDFMKATTNTLTLLCQNLQKSASNAADDDDTDADKTTKTPEKRIPSWNWKTLRFISSLQGPDDTIVEVDKPGEQFMTFLECSEKISHSNFVHLAEQQLRINMKVCRYLTVHLWFCQLVNYHPDQRPQHFSVFLCAEEPCVGSKEVMSSIEWTMNSTAKTLTQSNIKESATPSWGVPLSVDQFIHQLVNFMNVCLPFSTKDGILYKALFRIVAQVTRIRSTLRERSATDRRYFLKILIFIELRIHRFFKSCSEAESITDVQQGLLNFTNMFNSILDGTFSIHVPKFHDQLYQTALAVEQGRHKPAVHDLSGDDADDGPATKKRKTDKGSGSGKLGQKSNPSRDKDLIIAKKDWSAFRSKGMKDVPTFNGTSACVKWISLGKCDDGNKCSRADTHRNLAKAEKTTYLSWLKQAKEAANIE